MIREKVLGFHSLHPVGTCDHLKRIQASHQQQYIYVTYQYKIYFIACPFNAVTTYNCRE